MRSSRPSLGRNFIAVTAWLMLLFPLAAAAQVPDASISRQTQIYALAEQILVVASTVEVASAVTVYATRFASVIDRSQLCCPDILAAVSLAMASPNLNAAAQKGLTAVRNSLAKCRQRSAPGPQPGINVGGGSDYKTYLPEFGRGYDND